MVAAGRGDAATAWQCWTSCYSVDKWQNICVCQ